MPNTADIPYTQEADLEAEALRRNEESIADNWALALCNQTFNLFEQYRSNNHDRRWNVADALYCSWMPPKVWDGTSTPRAQISNSLVFSQIESLIPAVSQAIFNGGADWFQVVPEGETDPEDAKQIQDSMSYYLDHPKDEFSNNAQAEIELSVKQIALYGNGGVSVEWDPVEGRPSIQTVDLRDFYIDPACPTPSISNCRAVVRRKLMTVDEILGLSGDSRMKIPSRDQLYTMSMNYRLTFGDETKRTQEALRGVFYSPGANDFLPNPADRRVEVLIYYSKQRIIWIFNREWVAYNGPNPYNFIPFDFAPCYIYSGRWYALSVADVQEPNQRYIEALLCARLDELSLSLHPPRVMPRGSNLTPAQLRWKPGAVYAIDKPKDAQVLQTQNVTANVFDEIAYLEGNAEKITGITSLAGAGVPRASNANRAAAGMQIQNAGSGNRVSHIVGNIEKYMIVPMLYKLYRIIQKHAKPGQAMPAYNAQDGVYEVDGSVFYKPVRFRMDAASRMITRDRLMQIAPFLSQFIMQGPLVQQLHQVGKTIDFEVYFDMLQDATGTGRLYKLMRPMNEDEKKAMQQPDPKTVAAQQQAQSEQQTRLQIVQTKGQQAQQIEQIKKQPDPTAQAAQQAEAQMEAQKQQQEAAAEQQAQQQDLVQQRMLAQLKIEAEREKHRTNIAANQAQLQLKKQEMGQKAQQSAVEHQMTMQQQLEQLAFDKQSADARSQFPTPAPTKAPEDQGAESSQGNSKNPNRPSSRAQVKSKLKAPK